MKKFLIVDKSNGNVASRYEAGEKQVYGGPWGNADLFEHIEVELGVDEEVEDIDSFDLTPIPEKWTKDGEADSATEPMRDVWKKEGEDDVYSEPLVTAWTKDDMTVFTEPTRPVWSKAGENDVYVQPMRAVWTKDGEEPVYEDPLDETWTEGEEIDPTWTESSESDPTWTEDLVSDPSWGKYSEVDPSWTYVPGKVGTPQLNAEKNKNRRINKKRSEMNTDIYSEMETLFKTDDALAAIAYESTWEKMAKTPGKFSTEGLLVIIPTTSFATGDHLDTTQKVDDYATEALELLDTFAINRWKRINQYMVERAVIENE